jgi:hypothetical protein
VAQRQIYLTQHMHEVNERSSCLLQQETQTKPFDIPLRVLVFVRNNGVICGGLSFDNIYVQTWPLVISWGRDARHSNPLFEADTYNLDNEELC